MNRQLSKNLLALSIVLFWFAQYVYIPYQTPYLTGLGLSAGFVGIIVGTYGIAQMVLRLPVGLMADHVGRHKSFILLGGLFAGSASLFRILIDGAAGFFIANILSGMASAMWISFMVKYTSYYAEDDQQRGTAHVVVFNYGGMLMGFVAASFLYRITSMRFLCLLSMIGGFASALAALFMENEQTGTFHPSVRELLPVCLNKPLVFYSGLALVQQGIHIAAAMSFTTQVVTDLGASSLVVGFCSITYMSMSVLFSYLSSFFVRKMSALYTLLLGFVCIIVYCLIVLATGSIPVIFLMQALLGFSSGLMFSTLTSQAMKEVPKHQKSTAMGFFQAVYALGMTVMPMLMGALAENISTQAAYLGIGSITAVTTVIFIFGAKVKKI